MTEANEKKGNIPRFSTLTGLATVNAIIIALKICLLFFLLTNTVSCKGPQLSHETPKLPRTSYFIRNTNQERLVVFVHGIFGDVDSTWLNTQSGASWPQLLMKDSDFNGYDVFSVSYYSPYVGSASSITEIANRVRQEMFDRQILTKYKQIFFITHSMGGLITKRIITSLHNPGDVNDLKRIRVVLFIAVPAKGADIAALGNWIKHHPQLSGMSPSGAHDFLASLDSDFRRVLNSRTNTSPFPKSYCSFETLPTVAFNIVPSLYAESQCDLDPLALDFDHLDIVKPYSESYQPYIWAKARILANANEAPHSGPISPDPVEARSFITQLTVWADIDADIYVDDRKLLTIDNSTGFDYAGARTRIGPGSTLIVRSRGIEKKVRLWDLCDSQSKGCEVRVGINRMSDVPLSEAEFKNSMGGSQDVRNILRDLQTETRPSARAWAAQRLGYIGDKTAVAGLLDALNDPDAYVQAVSARALGHIGDPTVLAQLRTAYARYQRKESYGYMFEAAIRDLELVAGQK